MLSMYTNLYKVELTIKTSVCMYIYNAFYLNRIYNIFDLYNKIAKTRSILAPLRKT